MTTEELLTEDKIFNAATDIFEEKGLAAARMQDIANKAGINKALLHYYFRTKEKLFAAVFDKLAEKMFQKFAGILEKDMPLEEKIRYFFKEHMNFLQKNQNLPLFILGEISRNPDLLNKILGKINFSGISGSIGENVPGISNKDLPHLMVTIVSLTVFPFVARPIIERILEVQGINYDDFINQRKNWAPEFVINSIKQSDNNSKLN